MMRALIVDDEAPARAKIRHHLEAASDVVIVGEATTGREAVASVKRLQPDLVFLDIQMPGLDGFAVLDALRDDESPYVVFVTADGRQALRAFEAGAVDYLLKPFTQQRFTQVLDRARTRLRNRHATAEPQTKPEFLERILVLDDGRATFVPVEEITRIESDRNYVILHARGESHRLRATIASIEERLDSSAFLRVNRSTIIRLDATRTIAEWSHGDYKVTMSDGVELIWSRRYRADALDRFGIRAKPARA